MMSYITSKELRRKFNNCSSTTLWRWQQPTQKIYAKPLPPPVRAAIGSQSLWDEKEIKEWEEKYFRNNKSLAI
ncbi:hypothetical protein ABLT35_05525 [Acinetobacter johnsonii]|jgi:predicted DNA-binding transcriptional regulator AlpA|uniref:AlpA family phage regulatory protein n=1 Tax=Acinetobacter johnsonii TaxID=40214 RepID=A0A1R7QAA7_ACIJO|nr:hypothetical protein [Acinetobacter johnsonii]MDH1405789.1 hypothetical protein [Acinetobacter johnsonii]SJX21195.1 hypothetical protein ACNJC6_00804 [Acinetobacter johnsonii]